MRASVLVPHLSVRILDEALHDREAEAGALRCPSVWRLCEVLEEVRDELVRDPVPRVGHARRDVTVVTRDVDSDRSGPVTPGVDEEVHEDLVDLVGIGLDDCGRHSADVDLDVETELVHCRPRRLGYVDRLADVRNAAGLNLGQEQHGVDEPVQASRLLVDRVQERELVLLAEQVPALRHRDREAADGGERRAELVRDRGDEPVLHSIELEQPLVA
jgi:hypothetical protein